MSNINERLDKLRKLVQDEDFLEGKGLSNEVNIRIFCYDPAEEMRIKHFVKLPCLKSILHKRAKQKHFVKLLKK